MSLARGRREWAKAATSSVKSAKSAPGDAVARFLPGLVAHVFHADAQAEEGVAFILFGRRIQKLGEKNIQVAGGSQPAGKNLGATAQIAQPILLEFLAKGLEHHFQPPERHAQLMQALDRAAGAQDGDIGGQLRQAVRQSGAKHIFRAHGAIDAGRMRLDRLGGAQTLARKRVNGGGPGVIHGGEFMAMPRQCKATYRERRPRSKANAPESWPSPVRPWLALSWPGRNGKSKPPGPRWHGLR